MDKAAAHLLQDALALTLVVGFAAMAGSVIATAIIGR
jgi:hypothetical protein